jgi:hypothetical protein
MPDADVAGPQRLVVRFSTLGERHS